jgi:hypothetical protein
MKKNDDRHFEKQNACFFSRKLLRAFHFPRCPPLGYNIIQIQPSKYTRKHCQGFYVMVVHSVLFWEFSSMRQVALY